MDTILSIIQELIALLGSASLAADLATIESIASQLVVLVRGKNALRDVQAQDAYNAAVLGSVTAAQYLYHNSRPDSGMPHQDIVDGQFYWAKLLTAGWTVTNETVVPPVSSAPTS